LALRLLEAAGVFGLGMSGAHWEHFAPAADVGVRGIGPTREAAFEQAAFEQAALALMHAIGDPAPIE
jgi:SHS2 domain-containing protein